MSHLHKLRTTQQVVEQHLAQGEEAHIAEQTGRIERLRAIGTGESLEQAEVFLQVLREIQQTHLDEWRMLERLIREASG